MKNYFRILFREKQAKSIYIWFPVDFLKPIYIFLSEYRANTTKAQIEKLKSSFTFLEMDFFDCLLLENTQQKIIQVMHLIKEGEEEAGAEEVNNEQSHILLPKKVLSENSLEIKKYFLLFVKKIENFNVENCLKYEEISKMNINQKRKGDEERNKDQNDQ